MHAAGGVRPRPPSKGSSSLDRRPQPIHQPMPPMGGKSINTIAQERNIYSKSPTYQSGGLPSAKGPSLFAMGPQPPPPKRQPSAKKSGNVRLGSAARRPAGTRTEGGGRDTNARSYRSSTQVHTHTHTHTHTIPPPPFPPTHTRPPL
jgi:hypothetical protein